MSPSQWPCGQETQWLGLGLGLGLGDVMLNGVLRICLGLFARQLQTPNR